MTHPELYLMVHRQEQARREHDLARLRAAQACPGCVVHRSRRGVRGLMRALRAHAPRLLIHRTQVVGPACCPA